MADIDGVDVFAVAGIATLQHRHEATGFDVRADVEEGEAGEADAAEAEAAGGGRASPVWSPRLNGQPRMLRGKVQPMPRCSAISAGIFGVPQRAR